MTRFQGHMTHKVLRLVTQKNHLHSSTLTFVHIQQCKYWRQTDYGHAEHGDQVHALSASAVDEEDQRVADDLGDDGDDEVNIQVSTQLADVQLDTIVYEGDGKPVEYSIWWS